MYRVIGVFGAAIVLVGCVMSQPDALKAFSPPEAEYAKARGLAAVKGQLFLRRADGVVVYGAGSEVKLIPRVAHSEEAVANAFKGGKLRLEMDFVSFPELRLDPGLDAFARRVKADGQGNFIFDGVPRGPLFRARSRVMVCAGTVWVLQQAGRRDRGIH